MYAEALKLAGKGEMTPSVASSLSMKHSRIASGQQTLERYQKQRLEGPGKVRYTNQMFSQLYS